MTVFDGVASFVDTDTVVISFADGRKQVVDAGAIVIATGSRPVRPPAIEFDEESILDSDGILNLKQIPQSLVVVGAGVIGIEYASMFAAVGTKVTVVDTRRELLPFCDSEIVRALQLSLRDLGVIFRLGETVEAVERHESGALIMLKSGKRIAGQTVLYSAGRQGATAGLGLEAIGVETDARGQIKVDQLYRTAVEGVYAVGDVIGFPALAATAMEQGRIASLAALGRPAEAMAEHLPIGIYSIPEISFVGKTEEELTEAGVPYEVGISRYRELARGEILGDTTACSSCSSRSTTARCWACTSSARAPPSSCTSARWRWASARPSTTSWARSSTTRRWRRPTRSPRWTPRTACRR